MMTVDTHTTPAGPINRSATAVAGVLDAANSAAAERQIIGDVAPKIQSDHDHHPGQQGER
jgi:hypothetical protein